MLQNVDILM